MTDPHAIYQARLADRRTRADTLQRQEDQVANARLAVFLGALGLAAAAWTGRLGWAWLWLPAGLFGVLVVIHAGLRERLEAARRAVRHVEGHLARLEDAWAGRGEAGARFLAPQHPYAGDLDLFGEGSLYELLCTARTAPGQEALARWLCHPAPPDEVRARQAAVAELRDRLDLRESLDLLGESVAPVLAAEHLARWGEQPARPLPLAVRIALAASSLAATLTGAAALFGDLPAGWFLALAGLQAMVGWRLRPRVEASIGGIDAAARELAALARIARRIEAEPVTSARLRRIQTGLTSDGVTASQAIRALGTRVDLLRARENQFFLPLALLWMWTTQTASLIEDWRGRHGASLRGWLAAVGDFEALAALSAHAFHHPDDAVPELAEVPELVGEGLGHPLLPKTVAIRNDVSLAPGTRLLVVSGSNMSGKSTFLRTVGTNVVLAQAGGTVRARRLRLGPLRPGATIRIQDSLREGASRFYAEITRLKQVVDLTEGEGTLLFLLDELLSGTNSHDRRAGSESILAGLLDRGALGLVTTHDLALTALGERLPEAANVHFEDRMVDGRLVFDYRMRPGVVRHSNALELMRSVGLEVTPGGERPSGDG